MELTQREIRQMIKRQYREMAERKHEYYFEVLRDKRDQSFVVRPELDGFSLTSVDYGKRTDKCASQILKTLREIKRFGREFGLKLPRGQKIEIRSTINEQEVAHFEPLSPQQLKSLVQKLNKQGDAFQEGKRGFEIDFAGKERR